MKPNLQLRIPRHEKESFSAWVSREQDASKAKGELEQP